MKLGNTEIPDDLYVVLVENDAIGGVYVGPIFWGTSLKHATLDDAQETQRRIGDRYGATRIAKLTLIEEKPQ